MTQLASDDFNRADNTTLGANWTVAGGASGDFHIATNEAQTIAAPSTDRYNAVAWPANQYAEVVVGSVVDTTTDTGVGPAVRINTAGAQTFYLAQTNTNETRLYKAVAGTFTQLGTDAAACATGDVLRIEAQGTSITVKKNGATIIGPITDSSIATGAAGIWGFPGATQPTANAWAGGDFSGGGAISGSSDLTFGAGSSALTGAGALTGIADAVFGAGSSTLTGAGALAGSSDITFSLAATLTGSGDLIGTSALVITPAAVLDGAGALAGASVLAFDLSGTLQLPQGAIAGIAALAFAPAGTLIGEGALSGAATVMFAVSGNPQGLTATSRAHERVVNKVGRTALIAQSDRASIAHMERRAIVAKASRDALIRRRDRLH